MYKGSGYKAAASDIERLLNAVAEDKGCFKYNQEIEDSLQQESDSIRYGNAHKSIKVVVKRMATVPDEYKESYHKIAPPLIAISKRLQKQILPKLRAETEGGRINGLLFGRRMNPRSLVADDGRILYNKK